MSEFDLQNYLIDWRNENHERFDEIYSKLDKMPELETRIALIEQTQATMKNGLWAMFLGVITTLFGYIAQLWRHN